MPDTAGLWKGIAEWLWLVLIPTLLALWNTLTARVHRVEDAVAKKADNEEFVRSRNAFEALEDRIRNDSKEDRDRLEKLQINVGRIEGKIDALLIRRRGRNSRSSDPVGDLEDGELG